MSSTKVFQVAYQALHNMIREEKVSLCWKELLTKHYLRRMCIYLLFIKTFGLNFSVLRR
jgi:hypothetical protein